MAIRNLVSFDWAMKRLLRNKANFDVLEGFLSELLYRKIIIKSLIESESNQSSATDKSNKVDILVEADDTEMIIIELQYNNQYDYFQRMLYGVSKIVTEYIKRGAPYASIRKIYSIHIVYFDLGEGKDYIYHSKSNFVGFYHDEPLQLSPIQQSLYRKEDPGDLFPEYYLIKVNGFDDVAKNTLDEWIFYLKNDYIRDEFTAQGIHRASEILAMDRLSDDERRAHERHIEAERSEQSTITTAMSEGMIEGKKLGLEEGEALGLKKGEELGLKKSIHGMLAAGLDIAQIANMIGISQEEAEKLSQQ